MQALSYVASVVKNRRGVPDQPRFLTYCVTFRCNAKCQMCDSWKKPPVEELTAAEIDRIFRQLPHLHGVRLTGGEPFLRADLPEIAALAQAVIRPLFLHITSNGFLTERVVRFCERRKPDIPLHLLISIDGMAKKHDTIRGVPSAWHRATSTLKALAPRQKELNISLAVNQTILDQEGMEEYQKLREFCLRIGVRHSAVAAIDGSAIYDRDSEVVRVDPARGRLFLRDDISRGEFEAWYGNVESDLAGWPFLARTAKRYYLAGIRHQRLNQGKARRSTCVALSSHLRLLPDGGIPVCQFNSTVIGRLRETPFETIWQSEAAQKARDWVRRCPGCWAECEVIPNAVYGGSLIPHLLAEPFRPLLYRWHRSFFSSGRQRPRE